MAEYYEQARFVRGRWKDDQLNEQHLGLLRMAENQWTPLSKFVSIENAAFRAKSSLHYAQAWAFVHFLFNGGREPEALRRKLLGALIDGASNSDAIEHAFGDVDLRALQSDFKRYVRRLE